VPLNIDLDVALTVLASAVDVVRRSATPHDAVLGWVERLGRHADIRLHPRARIVPGVLVYRLDDRLFFANTSYVRGRIREAIDGAPAPGRWLVFDAEGLSHVDATGIEALTQPVQAGESPARGEDAPQGVAHPLMVKARAPARRRQRA
jgi:SulP family sulfate permease